MTWRIPIGWNRKGYVGTFIVGRLPSEYESEWEMSDAAIAKSKHGQTLMLTSSGAVFLGEDRVTLNEEEVGNEQ